MYISKINHNTYDQIETISISPLKLTHHPQNLLNSRISKKDSFLSERPTDSGRDRDGHEYSDSFRQMMNKVLNRICKKNNFLRIKKRKQFVSLNRQESQKQTGSQIYQSLSLENKIIKKNGFSKLKIEGVGRTQNDSNLLKKNVKQRIYNKTSISFVKNKQFRKSIDLQKAKSMPSYGKIGSEIQKEKQNESFLNNLNRITFNNSFYPKVNEIRNVFDQSCKVETIIPKFQIRENYQKMQEVFKKELEPKHKKIELAKKLLHKKMVERQRNNERHSQSFIEKPKLKPKIILIQEDQDKNQFEPWNTHEDIHEDMLKVYQKFPA